MDVAIVGAGGVVGRAIAAALVQRRLLPTGARLQLVGRREGPSAALLPGIAADLADGCAEDLPEIDIALDADDVLADIVIVACGDTVRPDGAADRADLAERNRPAVEQVARAVAAHGHGEELVLVLTNPVEAMVAACCRHIDRRRVIGLGAYLDTLRFRREIAADLGVRRQLVRGMVLGEHGPGMVPCWSTVGVLGFDTEEGRERLRRLRREDQPTTRAAIAEALEILRREGPAAAYRRAESWGPDLRAAAVPLITQMSGARTPVGSGEMVLRLLETILGGGQVAAAAQILLDGEFLGIRGVTGAPVVLSSRGVEHVIPLALKAAEAAAVRRSVLRA